MGATKRKSRSLTGLSDQLVNEIAYLYIRKSWGAVDIARYLEDAYSYEYDAFHLSNESIRHVLAIAIERGIVRLMPSNEEKQAGLLRERCRTAHTAAYPGLSSTDKRIMKSIRVLDVGGRSLSPHAGATESVDLAAAETLHGAREFETSPMVELIADAAAEVLLDLIHRVGHNGQRVHIGLGAGNTSQCVVRRLGKLVRWTSRCPPLALHALTPGFSTDPLKSPVTYFRFFEKSGVDIEYVGFSAAPIVDVADLPTLQREPGYVSAAAKAKEIDIVITSLARAGDPHGMLERYLKKHYRGTYDQLKKRAWKGDVQFCPFSDEPLELDQGARAVSLLGLNDLKAMVEAPNKYVLLVAGPCNACGELKTEAIAPLLVQPSLNLWTHLVTDVATAESLTKLSDDGGKADAGGDSPQPGSMNTRPNLANRPRRLPSSATKRKRTGKRQRKGRPPR